MIEVRYVKDGKDVQGSMRKFDSFLAALDYADRGLAYREADEVWVGDAKLTSRRHVTAVREALA